VQLAPVRLGVARGEASLADGVAQHVVGRGGARVLLEAIAHELAALVALEPTGIVRAGGELLALRGRIGMLLRGQRHRAERRGGSAGDQEKAFRLHRSLVGFGWSDAAERPGGPVGWRHETPERPPAPSKIHSRTIE
jgi:hypothetical protein